MKKYLCIILCIALCGCAHAPRRGGGNGYVKDEFVDMNSFCRTHHLTAQFDTIDDMVRLESGDKEIRLLLNSIITYVNGTTFYLDNPPYYRDGHVFVPRELAEIAFKKAVTRRETPVCVRTIVIDPGHGGKDPGAISPYRKIREKDVNLSVSKLLKQQLEKKGFKVYLTRDKDTFLTLKQRTEIAKAKQADLFISVHANANRSRKISGVEIYYLAPKYFNSEAKSIALAEKSSFDFQGQYSKTTRTIIWDLICSENNAVSLKFASLLTGTLKKMGFHVPPPRGAPFYVLKNAYVPSVLVETGYLTNKNEERLLTSAQYQRQLIEAITLGIDTYNKRFPQFVKEYGNAR